MSPWHIFCLWHWCRAHNNWNVIHFFSNVVRNGRVETLSYKLCLTYSRMIRHALSVNYGEFWIKNDFGHHNTFLALTTNRWKGKQLTAWAKCFLMYSNRSACDSSGRLGSCLTNTFTTTNPSSERTRATLKKRVLPMLRWGKGWILCLFCLMWATYLDSYCKSDSNEPIR